VAYLAFIDKRTAQRTYDIKIWKVTHFKYQVSDFKLIYFEVLVLYFFWLWVFCFFLGNQSIFSLAHSSSNERIYHYQSKSNVGFLYVLEIWSIWIAQSLTTWPYRQGFFVCAHLSAISFLFFALSFFWVLLRLFRRSWEGLVFSLAKKWGYCIIWLSIYLSVFFLSFFL